MVIVKEEGCNVDKITNTIQRFIPDISYDQNIGKTLIPKVAPYRVILIFSPCPGGVG